MTTPDLAPGAVLVPAAAVRRLLPLVPAALAWRLTCSIPRRRWLMDALLAYVPQDRRAALATGHPLPDHCTGAALFADISGFTPLTEALTTALGPRRGGEALTDQINAVYAALIAPVDRYGGSVIGFAGDAITCWFDDAPLGGSAD